MQNIVARDPRVLAILTRPDDYFTNARRTAWRKAREDVATDLERRARQRRNGIQANGILAWTDRARKRA